MVSLHAMQEFTWELSERDTVTLRVSALGAKELLFNLRTLETFKGRKGKPIALSDGRTARVVVTRDVEFGDQVELRVDGSVALMTVAGQVYTCPKCGAEVRPYDKSCRTCTAVLPSPDGDEVTGALIAIAGIVTLTLLRAVNVYRSTEDVLKGRATELSVTLFAALCMLGLLLWARRSPLPAILLTTVIYAASLVQQGIHDPESMKHWILLKVFVLVLLYHGITASVRLRKQQTKRSVGK